jgi:H+/Cl- antiporter ClcA/CBS domain-containing protein
MTEITDTSTTEGLPVAPGLSPSLKLLKITKHAGVISPRVIQISAISMVLGIMAGFVAQGLVRLIGLITNLSFFGRFSTEFVTPVGNHLGLAIILIPVGGGLIIGLMARYGAEKIRGHGIPEAMEQVLLNESKMPARMTILKPLSAAVSIGTGGPFGAEGPIIATGGAVGSLIGQLLQTTASERKTLLAAGAAAGLTATFGNPVSSLLLAIELLLFEFSPRSFIPVGLACSLAAAVRIMFEGTGPAFHVPDFPGTTGGALFGYLIVGTLIGVASAWLTHFVYWLEAQFEKIPIHWMWYPAIGGLVVGIVGYFIPETMGPGYGVIESILSGGMMGKALGIFVVLKFISWTAAVGSGTSGGTLAPMFAIGGCLGGLLGEAAQTYFPALGVSPIVAALVGMAAIFAGASRALLASVLLAFETTHQAHGVLPLLAGCSAAFLASGLMMRENIMTEKFHRHGIRVPEEFTANPLEQIGVLEVASKSVVTLRAEETLKEVRKWFATHAPDTFYQGYPVLDQDGVLRGVVLRRELVHGEYPEEMHVKELITRPAAVIPSDCSLQEATQLMLMERVGRLVVVSKEPVSGKEQMEGILTRRDIHQVYERQYRGSKQRERTLRLRFRASEPSTDQ